MEVEELLLAHEVWSLKIRYRGDEVVCDGKGIVHIVGEFADAILSMYVFETKDNRGWAVARQMMRRS